MSIVEVVVLLVIAGVCGGIGGAIGGRSRGGCLASILLGFAGALLGTWLSRQLGLPDFFVLDIGEREFPIVWSVIGSALFVAVLGLIGGRGRGDDS